jgi:hypothetical protein
LKVAVIVKCRLEVKCLVEPISKTGGGDDRTMHVLPKVIHVVWDGWMEKPLY